MKWLLNWIMQSFFYMVPIIAIFIGGVIFVTLTPKYGFYITLLWAGLVCWFYVKYSKWY